MARSTRPDLPSPDADPNENLTISELCAELKVSRSTFYEGRQKRRGPRCIRLSTATCASAAATWTPGSPRRRSRETSSGRSARPERQAAADL
jgi:hypothetical protein